MSTQAADDATEGAQPDLGHLFEGTKFWLSHQVPQRTWFISQIKSHGGEVVEQERQADVKLVDHTRKILPAGCYSYKFVELSIRQKRLEKLDDHAVGPHANHSRPVGSYTTMARGGRIPFTGEDDQYLIDWVKPIADSGGSDRGNEIYKQIEAANPRHTWQSWRDRWIKHVSLRTDIRYRHQRDSENSDFVRDHSDPSRPSARSDRSTGQPAAQQHASHQRQEKYGSFSGAEAKILYNAAKSIAQVPPENAPAAWREFAASSEYGGHTVEEWQHFWETYVRPIYEDVERRKKEKASRKHNDAKSPIDQANTHNVSESSAAQPGSAASNPDRQTVPSDKAEVASNNDNQAARSPSFQPESPTTRVGSPSLDKPASNEARKRSHMRRSSNVDGADSPPPAKRRKHTDTQEERQDISQSFKLPSKLVTGTPPLNLKNVDHRREVPASPEQPSDKEDEIRSPEAVVRTTHTNTYGQPYSPLFLADIDSEAGDEEEDSTPKPLRQSAPEQSPRTSPLKIRLDLDDGASSSVQGSELGPSAQAPRLASEELGEEEGSAADPSEAEEDNFETAQPELESETSETFETAPQPRVETQALLKETQADFDLGIPEPEGGWEAYDDFASQSQDQGEVSQTTPKVSEQTGTVQATITSEPVETTFPSSPPQLDVGNRPHVSTSRLPSPPSTLPSTLPACTDIDTYITTRLSHHLLTHPSSDPTTLELLLLTSARRTMTSSLTTSTAAAHSFHLADIVFEHLRHGKPVPSTVPGIWTEDDDNDLIGGDARGVERVRRKHGDMGVEGRWEVLDVLGGGHGGEG